MNRRELARETGSTGSRAGGGNARQIFHDDPRLIEPQVPVDQGGHVAVGLKSINSSGRFRASTSTTSTADPFSARTMRTDGNRGTGDRKIASSRLVCSRPLPSFPTPALRLSPAGLEDFQVPVHPGRASLRRGAWAPAAPLIPPGPGLASSPAPQEPEYTLCTGTRTGLFDIVGYETLFVPDC